MDNYQKRGSRILEMRKDGASYRKIGNNFGISKARVRQILLQHKQDNDRRQRSEEIRRLFSSSNDIEEKWPKDVIVDGLLLQGRPRWSLQRHLDYRYVTEASLKDVMDFLIADYEKLPTDPREAMPAYRQKNVGRKTYSSLVHHLSEQDLGEAFNTEWARRLEKLMRYLTRTGQHVPLLLRRYL